MNKNFAWFIVVSIFFLFGCLIYSAVFVDTSSSFDSFNKNIFSFYRSEISINGDVITENLYFTPDTSYHTLFRNFASRISLDNSSEIIILNVSCSSGQAYFTDYPDTYLFADKIILSKDIPYTEENEYGCTFGNELGFQKGKNYSISAEYKLNPKNIVVRDNQKYIKFVVYSAKKHNQINIRENFILSGNYSLDKTSFSSSEDVVIYVPVSNDSTIPVFTQTKDDSSKLLLLFLCFIPAIFFSLVWFFSREKSPSIGLNYSSTYPKDRPAWQVASGFVAPFNPLGPNVFSSLFLELFNKKAIDIQIREKKPFVLLKSSSKLDEVESIFYNILEKLKENSKVVDSSGYFSLEQKFSFVSPIKDLVILLRKKVESFRKEVQSKTLSVLAFSFFFIYIILSIICLAKNENFSEMLFLSFFFSIFISIILIVFILASGIAVVFKDDFYTEYTHWKAFRKFLVSSDSIKNANERATILWEKYLVYAAALSVPRKIIEHWKDKGYVSSQAYNSYYAASFASNSFVSSSGAGAGGVGGGGVGGGGAGGR